MFINIPPAIPKIPSHFIASPVLVVGRVEVAQASAAADACATFAEESGKLIEM
jgi:hypothetical protein